MGCYRLWVGAESGSQRILDAMDRRTDARRMRDIIALLRDHGIRAGTFIMLGYLGETWADINATATYLKAALPDDVLTTLAYPIKGTPYYDDVEEQLVAPADWEKGSDRDITITGRGSRRFYQHAQRWIQSELELARAHSNGQGYTKNSVKSFLRARRERAAMYLTRLQVENGRQGP